MKRQVTAAIGAVMMAVSVLASPAAAQDTPQLRFYLVPKAPGRLPNSVKPKYVPTPYYAMDYGLEDTYLVGSRVTAAQHAEFSANVDVIALPPDIDTVVGLTAVATVKAKLEGLFVPGDDVSTNLTWRQLIGQIGRIFLLMQRYHGLYHEKFFLSAGDLDTRLNQLSGNRARLATAAQDLASSYGIVFDLSGIKQTTTVREALRLIAAQLPPFTLAGESF